MLPTGLSPSTEPCLREGRSPAARCGAAAALPGMQRDRRDAGRAVRRLLAGLRFRGAALLRALRRSLRRGSRRRGMLCGACLARPPRYRRARAALVYDARSRRLVLPFKHGDRTDIARACGRWMARAGAELLAEADLVAPVPLHWRRLFTRRYNQAQLLARVVVREAAPASGLGSPPTCCAGGAGPARRAGCAPRSGGATSGRPSTSIRAGRRRWRARPSCWSTTC